MSQRRLILCLDPARLLRPPCPVLFPEWDRELLVITRGMRGEDWSRVASALAAAESHGVRPEAWCLTDAGHWPRRTEEVESLCASAPPTLRSWLLGPVTVLLWLSHGVKDDCPTDGATVVRTRFEGPAPADAETVEQLRLLPIGLRVLIDRQVLLAALGHPAHKLGAVSVVATSHALLETELGWGKRLVAAKRALAEAAIRLQVEPCAEPLYVPERFASLSAEFAAEHVEPLSLSLFQRLHVDEASIREWFEQEATKIEEAVARHQQLLEAGFEQAIGSLTRAEPTAAPGGETRTCTQLRDDLQKSVEAGARQEPSEDLQSTAARATQEWVSAHRANVVIAAARRVTAQLLATVTVVALLFSALGAMIGFSVPMPASAGWRDLLPAAVMGSSVIVVSLAAAVVYWQLARRAVRAARDALTTLRKKLRQDAESATGDTEKRLERTVQSLNLAALERACEEKQAQANRVDAHADALQSLIETVHEEIGEARTEATPVIDPRQAIERVPAYWWEAGTVEQPLRVCLGAHSIDGSQGSELHQLLRRYAGAIRVELG